MPTITIAADTSQATSSMNAFAASLQATNERIGDVTKNTATFNAAGQQTSAVISGMTRDGQAFAATFKRIADQIDPATKAVTSWRTELQKISYSSVKQLAQAIDEVSEKSGIMSAFFARAARSLQYFLLYKGFNLITEQIKEGTSAAKDFQIQLSLIRTISQDSQQSFVQWAGDVRKVSDESGISIDKIGKGFYDVISNQVAKGSQTKEFVKTAADLARVTGSELPDAVNTVTSAINAYGLSASDAERISAVMFKTIDEGRVVMSEMANTLGRVYVIANSLGVSMENVNAVIAITTQKGFKTSDAMTLLTNLMIKLEKPTEDTKEFFKGLGVETGEAAVKLLGFNGVLRKMVEAVASGKVKVSAFFDEIRGRKQFAVFQQAIDQIDTFTNKLEDTQGVMNNYKKAVEIRGESPADKLVIEMNKLKNIFTVDAGQWFLRTAQGIVEFVSSIEHAAENVKDLIEGLKYTGGLLVAWAAGAAIARVATYAWSSSVSLTTIEILGLGAAIKGVLASLGILLVGIATFEIAKRALGTQENPSTYNKQALASTISGVEKLKNEYKALREAQEAPPKTDTLDVTLKKANEGYKSLIGIIAQATLANDKLLESAKLKSKEAGEALKVGFGSFSDRLKANLGEIKKHITEANHEIEKSAKFMQSIGDTIDDLIYKSQHKFGDEQQKLDLTEIRIGNLQQKIKELYATGDKDKIQEARQLTKEVLELIQSVEEGKEELKRKDLERYLEQNPLERTPGGDVFTAQTVTMQQRLLAVKAEIAALEKGNVANQEKQIANSELMVKKEDERLRKLQQAFKAYEDFDVFTKEGKIKPEFRTEGGKLDRAKLEAEISRINEKLVDAGGSFTERIQMMQLLQAKRLALIQEAGAAERDEAFKTAQQVQLQANETYKNDIESIKKRKEESIKAQTAILTELGEKSHDLAAMGGEIQVGLGRITSKPEYQRRQKEVTAIMKEIEDFQTSLKEAFDPANKIKVGDQLVVDPARIDIVADRFTKAVKRIEAARDLIAPKTDLTAKGPGDTTLTPGEAAASVQDKAATFAQKVLEMQKAVGDENQAKNMLKFQTEALKDLQKQFPELAQSALEATMKMDEGFRKAAGGGITDLIDKLKQLKDLMPKTTAPGSKEQSSNIIEGSGEVYLASGGIVGAFPGQPRGVDKYPIWAAKGEYIVNAASTALFKPMLEAINAGRFPRYMASGGRVGDTNIGDISVSVTGGATGSQTGRTIARELERELRRRTINLTRR